MGDTQSPMDGAFASSGMGGIDPNTMGGMDPNAMGGMDPNTMGGMDPNAMGGDPNAMGGDPNAMGGMDPNAMGGDPNAMGGDSMMNDPAMGSDPAMDGQTDDSTMSIINQLSDEDREAVRAYAESMLNGKGEGVNDSEPDMLNEGIGDWLKKFAISTAVATMGLSAMAKQPQVITPKQENGVKQNIEQSVQQQYNKTPFISKGTGSSKEEAIANAKQKAELQMRQAATYYSVVNGANMKVANFNVFYNSQTKKFECIIALVVTHDNSDENKNTSKDATLNTQQQQQNNPMVAAGEAPKENLALRKATALAQTKIENARKDGQNLKIINTKKHYNQQTGIYKYVITLGEADASGVNEVIFTKKQLNTLMENFGPTEDELQKQDERKPLQKKNEKTVSGKSPFNSPKFK